MSPILYYVHDPMCSWCWGYRPTWQRLRAALPTDIQVIPLLGGLAADTDQPMSEAMQARLQQTWRTISARLGACRIWVIVASMVGERVKILPILRRIVGLFNEKSAGFWPLSHQRSRLVPNPTGS